MNLYSRRAIRIGPSSFALERFDSKATVVRLSAKVWHRKPSQMGTRQYVVLNHRRGIC